MMLKKAGVVVVVSIVLAGLAGTLQAETYTVNGAVATDNLRKGLGSEGYPVNDQNYLYWGSATWVAIQFDLPHEPGESINSVTSATLRLVGKQFGWTRQEFEIWLLTEPIDADNPRYFEEGELPSHSDVIKVTYDPTGMPLDPNESVDVTPLEIDVTSLLANNADRTTFGLLLRNSDDKMQIYSRNYANDRWKPKLTAEYSAVPEPGTAGLILGGLAVSLLRRKR